MASQAQRPELAGVRIRKRKKDVKAKFEPEAFRDAVVSDLKALHEEAGGQPLDSETLSKQLFELGESFDLSQRYGELLLDILFTGGVLDGGGAYTEPDAELSPISVFATEEKPEAVKRMTEAIQRLLRRYRYLQQRLEECIRKLLRVLHRFEPSQVNKLSMSFAYLFASQMVPVSVLDVLFSDHLVKEGLSLQAITTIIRIYLTESSLESFTAQLRKAEMEDKLLDFFPPNKRTSEFFARHFEAEGLEELVQYQRKKSSSKIRDTLKTELVTMIQSDASHADIIAFLRSQREMPEHELIVVAFDALMASIEWSQKAQQSEEQAIKQIKDYGKILAALGSSARAQVDLLKHVQAYCYDDPRFTKSFTKLVTLLYKMDAVTENAIVYWNNKGALPLKGKSIFLKQIEPLIKFFNEAEEEDEEEAQQVPEAAAAK